MKKTKWKIEVRGIGHQCRIWKDGELFTECEAIRIDAKAGELTRVHLILVDPEIELDLTAIEDTPKPPIIFNVRPYPFCLWHDQGRKDAPCFCGRIKSGWHSIPPGMVDVDSPLGVCLVNTMNALRRVQHG